MDWGDILERAGSTAAITFISLVSVDTITNQDWNALIPPGVAAVAAGFSVLKNGVKQYLAKRKEKV